MGDEEVTSTAEGQAYGAEFQARINSAKGFNLNLAYTLVRSEFEDGSGKLIPSSWDSKHLLTLTTTKELKRNWRIGARWRFVGGLPYTPWDLEKSSYVEAWDAQGGPYPDYAQLNSLRLDPFHQLDLRIDKAYYFNKLTAKFYIDIQNFYNFQGDIPLDAPKESVFTLKMLLRELGFDRITLDYNYDHTAREAVQLIQQRHGLEEDGIVGTRTRIAIYNEQKQLHIPHIIPPDIKPMGIIPITPPITPGETPGREQQQ